MMTYEQLANSKFTDKATYLEWRKNWREYYAQLSAEIRAQRAEIKELGAARASTAFVQARKHANKVYARYAVQLRKQSKIRCQQLWQLEHPGQPTKLGRLIIAAGA